MKLLRAIDIFTFVKAQEICYFLGKIMSNSFYLMELKVLKLSLRVLVPFPVQYHTCIGLLSFGWLCSSTSIVLLIFMKHQSDLSYYLLYSFVPGSFEAPLRSSDTKHEFSNFQLPQLPGNFHIFPKFISM